MAYRSYSQTPFNITLVMLDEYGKKLVSFCKFTLGSLLIFVVLSFLLGAYCAQQERLSEAGCFDCLACGSWLLLDIFPDPEPDFDERLIDLLRPCRAMGFVLSGLFAGVSVSIFLEPVNSIAFSRYAVIDTENDRLCFRYWIRKTEGHYLHDAQMELLITQGIEHQNGSTGTNYLFRYREPENTPGVFVDRYTAIRGVRCCEIPLDHAYASDGRSLREVLVSAFGPDEVKSGKAAKSDWRLLFRVVGTDESGRVVYRDKTYRFGDVLYGYAFLSIRRDEVTRVVQRMSSKHLDSGRDAESVAAVGRNLRKRSGKNMFHEHFHVVYKLPVSRDASLGLLPAMFVRPVDLYCKEEVDCVARGFRIREACFLACECCARYVKRTRRLLGRLTGRRDS